MIRVTNSDCAKLLKASDDMAAVELDNDRGNVAAELHAACTVKQLAYQFRMKALEKERARILKNLAQHDARGKIKYGESPDGDPGKRPVLWINERQAEAASDAWAKKVATLEAEMVELDLSPVKDDFFAKPHEVMAKHGVRIAFLPFMAKAQGRVAKPKKKR